MLTLQVEKRNTGKVGKGQAASSMPAVFYGAKEPSTSIAVSRKEFEKVWRKAGESTIITLAGLGEDKEALIHEVDTDPVTDRPRHADFYVIEKGKTMRIRLCTKCLKRIRKDMLEGKKPFLTLAYAKKEMNAKNKENKVLEDAKVKAKTAVKKAKSTKKKV